MQNVSQILRDRKNRNKKERMDRIQRLEESNPEFYNLTRKRNELLADIALLRITGKKSEANSKMAEVQSLDNLEQKILKDNNLPSNYLDEIITCPICNDTGIDQNGKTCQCVKSVILEQSYGKYDLSNLMKESTFENSNPGIFSTKRLNNEPGSARESLVSATNRAAKYLQNFDNETSLYITGQVGTGKTYFVSCLVNELLKQQKQIIYLTAPNLANYLYEDLKNRDKIYNSNKEEFKTVELLVIDDLGTEVVNRFVESCLTEIIDYRLVKKLKTIITSNYNPPTLLKENIYPERMISRIMGNYEVIPFFGSDLRNEFSRDE